jgi:hypothetical protein
MWAYMIVAFLVLVGIVGGIFAGGIFTIVLLPIAAIILIASVAYRSMGAAAQRSVGGGSSGNAPLPHNAPGEPGHVRTSPERLADARRAQQ